MINNREVETEQRPEQKNSATERGQTSWTDCIITMRSGRCQ
jgi:hypothetical protein